MELAIDAGASIINDISALSDKKAAYVIAKNNVGLIIMHMKGQPNNMQKNPKYRNVSYEVFSFLNEKKQYAIKKGIKEENILIDPGIGFGKNDNHNIKIFKDLALFHYLKSPYLSFICFIILVSSLYRIFFRQHLQYFLKYIG